MKRKGSAGPIAFFVSLFIVTLGTIQLVSAFHTYALNLAELNGLKREEASLIAQKQDLENEIKRWDDKAYVTAQARERLGFVFPGEQAVRVLHPEAVTGQDAQSGASSAQSGESSNKVLPWYEELAYAFRQADKPEQNNAGKSSRAAKQSGSPDDASSGTTDRSGINNQSNAEKEHQQ